MACNHHNKKSAYSSPAQNTVWRSPALKKLHFLPPILEGCPRAAFLQPELPAQFEALMYCSLAELKLVVVLLVMIFGVEDSETRNRFEAEQESMLSSSSFSSVPKLSWSWTISSMFSVLLSMGAAGVSEMSSPLGLEVAWAEHKVTEAEEVEGPAHFQQFCGLVTASLSLLKRKKKLGLI